MPLLFQAARARRRRVARRRRSGARLHARRRGRGSGARLHAWRRGRQPLSCRIDGRWRRPPGGTPGLSSLLSQSVQGRGLRFGAATGCSYLEPSVVPHLDPRRGGHTRRVEGQSLASPSSPCGKDSRPCGKDSRWTSYTKVRCYAKEGSLKGGFIRRG